MSDRDEEHPPQGLGTGYERGYPEPVYPHPPYPQPAYPQPAYPQPVYGYVYPAPQHAYSQPPPPPPWAYPRPTNGLAVASLVLSVVWMYWLGSILALIFGYVARRQIRERGESGRGMAIAGIVLGWIGVATLTVLITLGVTGVLASD